MNMMMFARQEKADDVAIISNGKILFVDDEPNITAVSQAGLTRAGFQVEAYNDPKQALSNFKRDTYDLIIVDIRMPKMNGFEFCREIRKRDEKVKVYFMTAFEMHKSEFERILPSTKVDGFIIKPVTVANLCYTVHSALNKSSHLAIGDRIVPIS